MTPFGSVGSRGRLVAAPVPPDGETNNQTNTMAKHDVFAIRQTRYDGERVLPGTKLAVDDSELPQLLSSGRFTTDPELAPKPAKAAKEPAKPEA